MGRSRARAGDRRETEARRPFRLPPIGFWSYSRQDDELSKGKLTLLRSLLMAEMQQQFGREPIQIFQDVSTIAHGAAWEREIRSSLAHSTFFIPIITPNFIQSEWCSVEVRIFAERERQLAEQYPDVPPRSRMFPILLIDIARSDPFDEKVLLELEKLQWFDFRGFRHKSFEDETVMRAISHYAASVSDLLLLKVTPRGDGRDGVPERHAVKASSAQQEPSLKAIDTQSAASPAEPAEGQPLASQSLAQAACPASEEILRAPGESGPAVPATTPRSEAMAREPHRATPGLASIASADRRHRSVRRLAARPAAWLAFLGVILVVIGFLAGRGSGSGVVPYKDSHAAPDSAPVEKQGVSTATPMTAERGASEFNQTAAVAPASPAPRAAGTARGDHAAREALPLPARAAIARASTPPPRRAADGRWSISFRSVEVDHRGTVAISGTSATISLSFNYLGAPKQVMQSCSVAGTDRLTIRCHDVRVIFGREGYSADLLRLSYDGHDVLRGTISDHSNSVGGPVVLRRMR